MKKVIITDYFKDSIIEKNILGKNVKIVCLDPKKKNKFRKEIIDADALLVWHAKINKEVIKKLTSCRAIVRYGVGIDNIDINYAKEKKIVCANTPDYGIDEVADTTCGLIISLARKIFFYNLNSKNYKKGWQENVINENKANPIKRGNQHNLGIIGLGRIGSAVALRMKSFGMNIGFYDPYIERGIEKNLGVKRFDSIGQLISFASIITTNCTLNRETKGIINNKFINKLNNNTILVNTARGAIIDKLDSLFKGLKSGKIGGVGLDVLPEEPPKNQEKLIKAWKNINHSLNSKIIINPHAAYYSSMSIMEMRIKAAESILNRIGLGKKETIDHNVRAIHGIVVLPPKKE